MAFKFNFPAPCRHVSDAEQDNCEEACEGRICTSEGKVPINRGGETVVPVQLGSMLNNSMDHLHLLFQIFHHYHLFLWMMMVSQMTKL
ncbi:uncharacterized protein LOC143242790 isoform X4 [Tachypleus tridentatus]|uniref:uncharacterized protein LOC143242790 isoform X4 n=1 Tax=Tachypleus tridentatus TaxID=6853 RepID=UPI003FD2F491